MNRKSHLRKFIIGVQTLSLITIISSCKLNPSEKQKLDKDYDQEEKTIKATLKIVNKNEPFSPSHNEIIELIEREDGDFDTPVEINYQDPDGEIWKAPIGTITDGASIPDLFVSFFGGKLNKEYLFAAIVHDAYCAIANEGGTSYHIKRWQDTHHMFYNACISNGTDITKASTMYAAVRLGGPRWPFQDEPYTTLSEVNDSILVDEMKKCEEWIISKGDTLKLEHIDKWMDDREPNLLKIK